MIHKFFFLFRSLIPGISVLQYVTFRSVMAAATSLSLSIIFGPIVICTLAKLKMNQPILDVGPKSHQIKSGTPTMGGSLIVFSIIASTLFWCDLTSPSVWVVLISLIGFGMVGASDDIKKLLLKQNLGLTSWQKMIALTVISLLVSFFILYFDLRGINTSQLSVPFFKKFTPHIGIFLVPWIWLVMVGTSNAVNLTDGLDGLAAGLLMISLFGFLLLQ